MTAVQDWKEMDGKLAKLALFAKQTFEGIHAGKKPIFNFRKAEDNYRAFVAGGRIFVRDENDYIIASRRL